MQRNILYCGAFRFPAGDAAAGRVYSIANLFGKLGFKVSFAGWESTQDESKHYVFMGHDCYPMAEFRESPQGLLLQLLGFLFRGYKTLAWMCRSDSYDVVIAYNPPAFFALGLMIFRRMRGFLLILDSTEWYESEHLPGGRFGLVAIENWIRMKCVYPRFENIICISRFLESYYKGRNTIRIPPLISYVETPTATMRADSQIRFLYAGSPGKKDLLTNFIRSLPVLKERLGRGVRLDIAGVSREELERKMLSEGMDPMTFADVVFCHGKLLKEEVSNLYALADFSILFRENKRYAHAGFPTKAVESWSFGCPIILNPVGDIGHIAGHMEDSIIVRPAQLEEDLVQSLRAALKPGQLAAMRLKSIRNAEKIFSHSVYIEALQTFLTNAGLEFEHSTQTNN
jgi:glycosyltransferase involved in cell wall biosynthesis